MQGYRGGNRHRRLITYLIGLWLACLPGIGMAQRETEKDLIWYVPQLSFPSRYIGGSAIVEYNSLQDLAEKLAQRIDKPYHLSIKLHKNTVADWQVLRSIPAAASLAVEIADSVMSDSLVQILASWSALKRLDITGITGPRSYTIVRNAKGEQVFGSAFSQKRLPVTGWARLQSVQEILITNEIDVSQALSVLRELPALESLTIQQFDQPLKHLPVTLMGLRRLRKLTLAGGSIAWNYRQTFAELPNLEELQISDPDSRELNAGLPYLTKLRHLRITMFSQSAALPQLRLGSLTSLQTLSIFGRARSAISLDSTLAGLTTLQRLSIEQTKLKAFPASLLANKELTYLSMPDADLETLPGGIDQLSALEELILDNNPLHYLPAAICKLTRLRRLSVSKCELDSLPAAIGQLTSLTGLSLNSNLLTVLPASMGQLKQLRQLNIAINQLTALPDELGTLPNLETIAAFWNKINLFPSHLSQVRELYLTDNLITKLPTTLAGMSRLRTLLLDNNPLTYLSDGIGQLDSLETLVLGSNQLAALPSTIGSLTRLRRFELGKNQVRSLPESIGGLTSLTSVSLKDNPIERLPESIGAWQKVTHVNLHLPHLEALPEKIDRWQALKSLTLESDRVLLLPDQLTDCHNLELLSVTGNRLIGLPESSGKLLKLASLTIAGRADSLTGQGRGQVMALPASLVACKALTELNVQHQQQFDATEGMHVAANLPSLNALALINCGITELIGVPWKSLLVSTLNLSQNRISQLPVAILDMPNLRQANFSETNLPVHLNRSFMYRSQLAEALKAEAPK